MPLTSPGITAGVLLVFVPALGLYAVNDILGGGKVDMIGNIIENQFKGNARNWPFGAALGIALMLAFAVAFWFTGRASAEPASGRLTRSSRGVGTALECRVSARLECRFGYLARRAPAPASRPALGIVDAEPAALGSLATLGMAIVGCLAFAVFTDEWLWTGVAAARRRRPRGLGLAGGQAPVRQR